MPILARYMLTFLGVSISVVGLDKFSSGFALMAKANTSLEWSGGGNAMLIATFVIAIGVATAIGAWIIPGSNTTPKPPSKSEE